MGFARDIKESEKDEELLQFIQPEDLLKYGLIPELIGRIPVVAPLHSLSEEAMKNILTEPKNALVKQYKKLFLMEGVELQFDPFVLDEIVKLALAKKTGARALRSIVEDMMLDIMYDLPDKKDVEKCIVTKDVIIKRAEPIYLKKEKKSA
jgi:ATP-dependent Clp protease ATP-binding subunit ClpX